MNNNLEALQGNTNSLTEVGHMLRQAEGFFYEVSDYRVMYSYKGIMTPHGGVLMSLYGHGLSGNINSTIQVENFAQGTNTVIQSQISYCPEDHDFP